MANFLMPSNIPVPGVTDEPGDVTRVGAVAVQRGPIGAIASSGGAVVGANYGDNSVSFVNPDRLDVYGRVPVAGEPSAVAMADDRVYVGTTSSTCDEVVVIDAHSGTVIANYPLAFSVTALAVSPDRKRVYAGRTGDDHADVAVIDVTAERVGTIDIAAGPGIGVDAVEVDSTGKRLYVATTDANGSWLVVVNTETARVAQRIRIGAPIRDVAFGEGIAYVLTSDRERGGVIAVVDLSANRVTGTVDLGVGAPIQMVLSPDATRAYVVDYDRVAVVCTLTHEVVNAVTVSARPSGVALDVGGSRLVVADYAGGITVFAVDSPMPLLYSELMATDPIAVPEARELQPAAV